MPKKKQPPVEDKTALNSRQFNTALSPAAREQQIISLAMDLAEQRIRNGTASSQEVTHFLKMGSEKHRMEMEKLQKENELLRAKTEALDAGRQNLEEMNAIFAAFKKYSGHAGESDDEYYDPNIYGIGGDF